MMTDVSGTTLSITLFGIQEKEEEVFIKVNVYKTIGKGRTFWAVRNHDGYKTNRPLFTTLKIIDFKAVPSGPMPNVPLAPA